MKKNPNKELPRPLRMLLADLENEAYNVTNHTYDYKQTNQVLRGYFIKRNPKAFRKHLLKIIIQVALLVGCVYRLIFIQNYILENPEYTILYYVGMGAVCVLLCFQVWSSVLTAEEELLYP